MRRFVLAIVACTSFGAEKTGGDYPVEIEHEKGQFSGKLSMTAEGAANKAKITWLATIKNTSIHNVHRAEFCVTAADKHGDPIKPDGSECVLRLWSGVWAAGASLTFKGNQRVMLSDSKEPVVFSSVKVKALEIYDQPPNVRHLSARCPLLWAPAIKAFGDKKFRPLVLDKETLTATFAFDGGQDTGYSSSNSIKNYTTASTAFFGPTWQSFRVDSASLYLQDAPSGLCRAEMKVAFAGLAKPFMARDYQWYALESNLALERIVLGQLETAAASAALADRDKGIAEIATKPVATPPGDLAAQMESLGKMFNAGLLTAEEFQQAKKKLLDPK